MTRDFTLDKYLELLGVILERSLQVLRAVDYLSSNSPRASVVVLRHDVDRNPADALRMARAESRLGVQSTYYFRFTRHVFRPKTIAEIADMGHEVGYHYEVLDRAKGDMEVAGALFAKELAEFRRLADVKTAAMHGNPLTKWDNRDLWKRYSLAEFGLIGEAYLSFTDVVYLSDTGRTWSPRNKVKDWMPSMEGRLVPQPAVESTDDLMRLLASRSLGPVYLTAHPERWARGLAEWVTGWARDVAINVVKSVLLRSRVCPEDLQSAQTGERHLPSGNK